MTTHRNFSFIIFPLFIFLTNSSGFDFYSHSTTYYLYDRPLNYTIDLFGAIALPRYFLLSVIYESFSKLGLPLGYVALFLIGFPAYHIFSDKYFSKKNNLSIDHILIILTICLLSFFYSASSISLIWLIASFLTKKKIFLFGGLLSPIGFVIFTLFYFISDKKIFFLYLFYTGIFFLFLYFNNEFTLLTSMSYENFRYTLDSINFNNLFFLIDKKIIEVGIAIFLSIIFFLSRKNIKKNHKFTHSKNKLITFSREAIILMFIVFFLSVFIHMSSKTGFIRYVFYHEKNLSVYISWFDFGEKEFFDLEYKDIKCHRTNAC